MGSAGSVSDVLLSKDDNGDEPLALESPKLSVKLAKAPSNSSGMLWILVYTSANYLH